MEKDVRAAITLDEFERIELRTEETLATVDLGGERRPAVTGLAQDYAPARLHRQSVFSRSFEESGGS
jgi:hypothetical protein